MPLNRWLGVSPFAVMREFSDEMDRAFRGEVRAMGNGNALDAWSPALDIRQCDGNLVITGGSGVRSDRTGAAFAGRGLRVSFDVPGFCEKPSFQIARELLEYGSLWNTFVMVAHVRGFLKMLNAALPDLVAKLRQCLLWDGSEAPIDDAIYDSFSCVNFAREALAPQASRIVAVRMGEIGWSDLGRPERVIAALGGAALQPVVAEGATGFEPSAGCRARATGGKKRGESMTSSVLCRPEDSLPARNYLLKDEIPALQLIATEKRNLPLGSAHPVAEGSGITRLWSGLR